MKKVFLVVMCWLPVVALAGPIKKIQSCIADGGVWNNNACYYMTEYDECTPATQFIDCQGGTTSTSGPGICVMAETGYYTCDYLYQQTCKADKECADYLGVKDSVYVCCQRGSLSSCLNPLLCR